VDSWVALEANSLLHLSNNKATVLLDITTLASSNLLRTTRATKAAAEAEAEAVAMERSPRGLVVVKSTFELRRSQTSPYNQD
jgi:hypothetical protein